MTLQSNYDNSTVRRQDRLLPKERAQELLQNSEYGFLAFGGETGYGIPINYVQLGDALYFHCAPEGEKLRRLQQNPQVTFCVVGHTAPQPAKFTTEYESVMAFGKLVVVKDDAERMQALMALVGKYSPDYRETGRKYAEKSFHRTTILRLDITRISGKCKRM